MQSRPLVLLAALAVLFAGGAAAAVSVLAAGKEAASTTTVGAELKDPDLAARFAPVLMLMNGELFHLIDNWKNWHESDLEQISIRLDASGKTPCEAGYSQHATGEVRTWGDVEK